MTQVAIPGEGQTTLTAVERDGLYEVWTVRWWRKNRWGPGALAPSSASRARGSRSPRGGLGRRGGVGGEKGLVE
jgi:hypothetical protein